jgi:hypothetical protein
MRQTAVDHSADSAQKLLYQLGGIAAFIVALFIPIQGFIFIAFPPPSTVIGYFNLFQTNWVMGLLDLDLLLIVDNLLVIVVFLALYTALKKFNEPFMLGALITAMVGIVLYIVSREATFSMLSLSNQYAHAATDAERAALLAAGQTLLTIYNGTVFDVSYVLGAVPILIIAFVMLHSNIFSKFTGYTAILMGAMMVLPPTIGMVGLIFSLLSLMPTLVWLILIGLKFFQLGRSNAVPQVPFSVERI